MKNKIVLFAIVASVVSCSEKIPTNGPGPSGQSQGALSPSALAPSNTPSHYYVIEEDGEYGYEPGLSQDDRNAGRTTKELVMV